MDEILKTTIIGLFFGTFGTTIGGVIGVKFNNTSKKLLSFILSFASGLMMSIVCFDLILEALAISDFSSVITGIVLGIIIMIICDMVVQNKLSTKSNKFANNGLLKTGIAVTIHDIPEGLGQGRVCENA